MQPKRVLRSKQKQVEQMKKIYNLAAVAAIMVSAEPASAAINLIRNGSFELATINPANASLQVTGPNTTSVTNWAVGGGSQFNYFGTAYDATAGIRSIDLSGISGGSIFQNITGLTVGKAYSISFALSNRPGAVKPGAVRVSTSGGTSTLFTFTGDPVTGGDMGWQRYAYRFIAKTANTRVAFNNANYHANRPYSAVIDNVIMTEIVPEPQTWALFVTGFGFVGFAMRSRSRNHKAVAA